MNALQTFKLQKKKTVLNKKHFAQKWKSVINHSPPGRSTDRQSFFAGNPDISGASQQKTLLNK